jgi:hypothetical protein
MKSIVKGNNKQYFNDFNYHKMFNRDLKKIIEDKIDFYDKNFFKSDLFIRDKYYSLPLFIKTDDYIFFEKIDLKNKLNFLRIINNIEEDLKVKIVFGFFVNSFNKSYICHNHIGYNYKFDRNLYTIKYILNYVGNKNSYFFCENDYIKFNQKDINKWYYFKTFRPHFFFNSDKNFSERDEFIFYFYKKDFFEKNKDEYFNYVNNIKLPLTNFKNYMAGDIHVKMMPKYFIFKKNKNKIIL